MKRKKAAKAWIYDKEKIKAKLKKVIRKVWRGERFPEE